MNKLSILYKDGDKIKTLCYLESPGIVVYRTGSRIIKVRVENTLGNSYGKYFREFKEVYPL